MTREVREVSAGAEVNHLESERRAEWRDEPKIAAPVRPAMKMGSGEAVYEQVSEHIRREPAQSTRLLEAWIGSGEGDVG